MHKVDFFTGLTALLLNTNLGNLKGALSEGVHDSKSRESGVVNFCVIPWDAPVRKGQNCAFLKLRKTIRILMLGVSISS